MNVALIQQHDPENFTEIIQDDELLELIDTPGLSLLNPNEISHLIKFLLRNIRLLNALQESDLTENPAIVGMIAKIRGQVSENFSRYGRQIPQAYETSRHFCIDPDLDPNDADVSTQSSLANFDFVTQQLVSLRKLALASSTNGKSKIPGLNSLINRKVRGALNIQEQKSNLTRLRREIFSDETVRMLHGARTHSENAFAVNNGVKVLEYKTVVDLMNKIYAKVYEDKAQNTTGVALCGPPGMGKTVVLRHLIEVLFGITPIEVDITEGHNQYTLLARPILIETNPIKDTLENIEILGNLPKGIKERVASAAKERAFSSLNMCEDDSPTDQFDTMVSQLESDLVKQVTQFLVNNVQRGPYIYGPIYQALENNVPIILNEVQRLREFEFLHGLMTVVPATDEEAGPEPDFIPTEDQNFKTPVGWFYCSITSRWLRVPENFRIFLTSNIGREYNSRDIPPATKSRYSGKVFEMVNLTPEEQVDLAWAKASEADGECMLSPGDARKLHILITIVIPKIEEIIAKKNLGKKRVFFSIRSIEILVRVLTAEDDHKCSFEEALFELFFEEAISHKYEEAIYIYAAIFRTSGLISQLTLSKISKKLPTFDFKKLNKMLGGIKIDANSSDSNDDENESDENCIICGLDNCPVHSELTTSESKKKQFMEFELTQSLLMDDNHKIQVEEDFGYLQGREQWKILLEYIAFLNPQEINLFELIDGQNVQEFMDQISLMIDEIVNSKGNSSRSKIKNLKILVALKDTFLGESLGPKLQQIQAAIQSQVNKDLRKNKLGSQQIYALMKIYEARKLGLQINIPDKKKLMKAVLKKLKTYGKSYANLQNNGNKKELNDPYEYLSFLKMALDLFGEDPAFSDQIKLSHSSGNNMKLLHRTLAFEFNFPIAKQSDVSKYWWSSRKNQRPNPSIEDIIGVLERKIRLWESFVNWEEINLNLNGMNLIELEGIFSIILTQLTDLTPSLRRKGNSGLFLLKLIDRIRKIRKREVDLIVKKSTTLNGSSAPPIPYYR
ncbi:hypothetical protein ACFL21_00180 [Patescibacteria group bacterium]